MSEPTDQPDILQFASLIAHQLQSPISAVSTILKTVVGELAGPLTPQQADLLSRASARCDQSVATVRRMLAIVSTLSGRADSGGVADLAAVLRRAQARHHDHAAREGILLLGETDLHPVWVRGTEPALAEVVDALVDNAFKYTPRDGRIRLHLAEQPAGRTVRLIVADSGEGIAEEFRQKVFEPFYRTPARGRAAPTGTGLGLSFVKAIVESVGGSVRADKADLGGAEIVVELHLAEPAELARQAAVGPPAFRVVIIGGVTAGPKVAAKVTRLMPHADVTVVEKHEFLSYAGCGLPYYISGVVKDQAELMSTQAGTVRDAAFFRRVKNVRILSRTEAVEIDRAAKAVRVRDLAAGRESLLEYDRLVLATGASPVIPRVPGVELGNVFSLHGVRDAEGIKLALAQGRARDVVIVGGGLLGMEMTEALANSGCRVTIVEMLPHTLGILDPEMARLVELHLESRGVRVLTSTKVESLRGEGNVQSVETDQGTLPADLVIMGIGVRPNVNLARRAGLEIGQTGALRVDEHMRTSDPDIYAAGDCAETTHLLTGRPCYVPLGSTATKQGRVAAVNLCGGEDTFPGVVGTTLCKVFDYCVARTGLTESAARDAGFDVVSALAPGPDRAHYMPVARMLLLKVVVDRASRRLLGAQAVGPGAGDKRIDVAAMAVAGGMTVDQLARADLGYAPPYSPALDNLITAANVVRNKLDGHMTGATAEEVHRMMAEKQRFVFLDVRTAAEYERVRLPAATLIPLAVLRGRLDELPRDAEIVTFSQTSLRGYEAASILKAAGFESVRVLDGGIEMWPYEKVQ